MNTPRLNGKAKYSLDRLATAAMLALQFGVVIWYLGAMGSEVLHTKKAVEHLDSRINYKIDKLDDRLRDAERGIAKCESMIVTK